MSTTMFSLSCTSSFQSRQSHLLVINKREPKSLFEKEKMINGQICLPGRCKWNADDVWAHRGGTSTGKGHVSGVKLKTADGTRMLPVQHSHLHPTLCAPDMDSPILWACTARLFLTHILKKWKKTWNLSNPAHRSWQTASREWSTPPGTTLYYYYSPSIQSRHEKKLIRNQLPDIYNSVWTSLTEKVWRMTPVKAFRTRIIPPLVEIRICLPSLLNAILVQSQTRVNVVSKCANGPFDKKVKYIN